jgi:hypothetical protein
MFCAEGQFINDEAVKRGKVDASIDTWFVTPMETIDWLSREYKKVGK